MTQRDAIIYYLKWIIVTALIVGLLPVMSGGCRLPESDSTQPQQYQDGIITPQEPADSQPGRCPGEWALPSGNEAVRDMVVGYMAALRDFKESAGPDGFVLLISPMNKDNFSRPVREAQMTIRLYEQASSLVNLDRIPCLRRWELNPGELKRFWAKTRLLDGYLLFLDWQEPVFNVNNLVFEIELSYPQDKEQKSICRRLIVHSDWIAPEEAGDGNVSGS